MWNGWVASLALSHAKIRVAPEKGGDGKRRICTIIHPSAPICVSTLHPFDVKLALRNQDRNKNDQSTLGFYRLIKKSKLLLLDQLWRFVRTSVVFRYELVLDSYTRYMHAGVSGHSSASHAPAMPKCLRPTRETIFFHTGVSQLQSHQIGQKKCD